MTRPLGSQGQREPEPVPSLPPTQWPQCRHAAEQNPSSAPTEPQGSTSRSFLIHEWGNPDPTGPGGASGTCSAPGVVTGISDNGGDVMIIQIKIVIMG